MKEYDNELRGALFKNKEKTEESHPDYTGSMQVEGQAYFFDAWLKKSKAGETYMSCRLKPKRKGSGKRSEAEDLGGNPPF